MNQIANIFEIKEETVELDYSKIDKAIDFTCAILKQELTDLKIN